MKVIVVNEKKMSEYFGVKVENGQDLINSDNKVIKNFIKEYSEVFTMASSAEIYDFFKKTGLFFSRVLRDPGDAEFRGVNLQINEWGQSVTDELIRHDPKDKLKVFRHHFKVIIDVDDIVFEKNKVYVYQDANKVLVYDKKYDNIIKERENKGHEIRKALRSVHDDISKQFELIKNKVDKSGLKQINVKDIKKIDCIYPYDEILILLNDGTLYIDEQVYSKNVVNFCSLNSYSSYIIYADNSIEHYTTSSFREKSVFYRKKILAKDGFLAELTDDNYLLITSDTDNLTNSSDNIVLITFENVKDIEFEEHHWSEMEYLIIKTEKGEIKLNTYTPIYDI